MLAVINCHKYGTYWSYVAVKLYLIIIYIYIIIVFKEGFVKPTSISETIHIKFIMSLYQKSFVTMNINSTCGWVYTKQA